MHEVWRADDGVDRAGIAAVVTTDALRLVNDSDRLHGILCQRHNVFAEQARETAHGFVATGRAEVDGRGSFDDGLGVRATAGEATLSALRLRKHVVYLLDEISVRGRQAPVGKSEPNARKQRNQRNCHDGNQH